MVSPPQSPTPAEGASLSLREWRGSGPPDLHIHHADDEAWYVRRGTLRFRFGDRSLEASAGTTVFAPAGTARTLSARMVFSPQPAVDVPISSRGLRRKTEAPRTDDHLRLNWQEALSWPAPGWAGSAECCFLTDRGTPSRSRRADLRAAR
ncbi:MAG: cupin domain-containing protein [Chloroflexi bacterium]|nr:cupin domain-containing protein [Chloroflexota bacterium]